jgi:flagellar biosynthesis protein FlhB
MPSDRKTEEPTPRRLRKARHEGDHPTSRALIGFGALGAALLFAPLAIESLIEGTLDGLAAAMHASEAPDPRGLGLRVGWLVAPLLAAAALGALVVGVAQTGGVLSSKPFAWNLGRLNPFARGDRSFGVRLVSLLLSLATGLGIGVAAWFCLRDDGAALAGSVGDASASLQLAARACRSLAGWALAVSLVAAAADSVSSYHAWRGRHRMTREEVRQEQRENDGDPALRRAREQTHRELASGGPMTDMAQASLLVLGAPRWAVALRYEPGRDPAPRVILRGIGTRAMTLQALAVSHAVPIEHDLALAQALASVPLDQEVPKHCYAEVAQALRRAGLFRPEP